MVKVDNAIIMAAGTSSRFAPLSFETHKALIKVKGEVLIERQIRQLIDANIKDIYIITGYRADEFEYLRHLFNVRLIHNPVYNLRNNNSSIWAARNVLGNSYVCSADNYFTVNPFEREVDGSYYAAEYADGYTDEWCMEEDSSGYISSVTVGGRDSWYMMGHTFWSKEFSDIFIRILDKEYDFPETAGKLWEGVFISHLDKLKMKIKKYPPGIIYEFDSLDELREFDDSYKNDTRSSIIKSIAKYKGVEENEIVNIRSIKGSGIEADGFEFDIDLDHYIYTYENSILIREENNNG